MPNATDELRRMLDERGVEWCDESNGYVEVTTFTVGGIKWNAIASHYINSELDWMRLRSDKSITPEQAIAATLGSGTGSSEAANPQIRCTDSKRNAPVRDREDSYTLLPCPFCGGEAHTIEPARYGKSWGVRCECGAFLGFEHTEAEAIAAWNTRTSEKAIAATLVSGTCEFNVVEEFIPGKRKRPNICECSNCRYRCAYGFIVDEHFKYCPNCGRRVIDDRQGE